MDRYIGLDVHTRSSTFAVIGPSGRRIKSDVVETNGEALVNYLKLIPGAKQLVLEEGTQSAWLYEILRPHVQEVVVTPGINNPGTKSDKIDAFALAEALRIGAIKRRVCKDRGAFGALRELVRAHYRITRDHVRSVNRLKAMFRSRGEEMEEPVYRLDDARWEVMAKKLPRWMRSAATLAADEARLLGQIREQAEMEMLAEAEKHSPWHTLMTCPGLGPIRTAQLIAIVVTPMRFRTRRQFWSYCGLAVVTRSSSDWQKNAKGNWDRNPAMTRGLNSNFQPLLKNIFVGAAQTILSMSNELLHEKYQKLVARNLASGVAKITIARTVAATALSMWKSGEVYDSAKNRSQK